MGSKMAAFLAGSTQPLRLGALAFVIAGAGVALAFSIDYGPQNPLAYVALGLTVVGIAMGFGAVAWGWYETFCEWTNRRNSGR